MFDNFNFNNLYNNSYADRVKMQEYLKKNGYYKKGENSNADGKFGSDTIKAIQRLVGTKDDGV